MAIEDEKRALDEVVERLHEKFPEADREEIEADVQRRADGFGDAAVRDFVPVLVEHEAADELRGTTPPEA